jgi:serine/threonine protein phosphatase PrpC
MTEEKDLDACAKRLVDESNKAGGEDNVTVVVVALDP